MISGRFVVYLSMKFAVCATQKMDLTKFNDKKRQMPWYGVAVFVPLTFISVYIM